MKTLKIVKLDALDCSKCRRLLESTVGTVLSDGVHPIVSRTGSSGYSR